MVPRAGSLLAVNRCGSRRLSLVEEKADGLRVENRRGWCSVEWVSLRLDSQRQ